jgi:hypothetical protein
VRSVIRADRVDYARRDCLAQCVPVAGRPQGRAQVGTRIEAGQRGLREFQLMGGDIGGDRQAIRLGAGQQINGRRAGQAADVHARAGVRGQCDDARHGGSLRRDRNAGQAESARDRALVGAAVSERWGADGQDDRPVDGGRVGEGRAQYMAVIDVAVGLAHGLAAGAREGAHGGKVLAVEARGQCADRVYARLVGLDRPLADQFDGRGGVDHR